jgi:hypothetical protein
MSVSSVLSMGLRASQEGIRNEVALGRGPRIKKTCRCCVYPRARMYRRHPVWCLDPQRWCCIHYSAPVNMAWTVLRPTAVRAAGLACQPSEVGLFDLNCKSVWDTGEPGPRPPRLSCVNLRAINTVCLGSGPTVPRHGAECSIYPLQNTAVVPGLGSKLTMTFTVERTHT